MSGCGDCGNCGGCARELTLSAGEIEMLKLLGQIPFLPVARRADSMDPVYLEDSARSIGEYSLILQYLERKQLISLDFDKPLGRFDDSAYAAYPIRGSMALTARGQQVLEMLDLQGAEE